MSYFPNAQHNLGASYLGNSRCRFAVWAPLAEKVEVHITAPHEQVVLMERDEKGYHLATLHGVEPGSRYVYCLDGGKERPDPASRFQPEDVHAPSQVVDNAFAWHDDGWSGLPLDEYVIYELHVGAFASDGTFDAVISYLDYLRDLGITAVELMPVAQFPGDRNWGYDGVYPFAVHRSYGGPDGLRRLVDACHGHGLAVVLDVVYNHLGPEGNYLRDFAPYFTDRYRTPWGEAINFDGPCSDEVRRFFIENALYWITEFHVDALRLDAVHAIFDQSAQPFLAELADAVHNRAGQLGRRVNVIAESDLNDSRLIRPPAIGGYGLDGLWSDDFHHSLHTLLTGEQAGYYRDFGRLEDLADAARRGFTYAGRYSPYRRRRHGNSPDLCDASQFVVCAQNHDQVGNRMLGERLGQLLCFDRLKLAASAVILSPFIPLLFMGEEYGEPAPFQYFISHLDSELVEAVRRGRREEFSRFAWIGEPPDPQAEETFLRSKLDHNRRSSGRHRVLLDFYKELLRLRRTVPALSNPSKERLEVIANEDRRILSIRRWTGKEEAVLVLNLSEAGVSTALPVPAGRWSKRLDSAERRWRGDGSEVREEIISEGTAELSLRPWSALLLTKCEEV